MSEPIDPKDFASYEEYLEALKRQEKFDEISEKVSEVVSNAKSDEEYQKGIEALGFTYHEDELCNRSYCQKNEICLWVALENFQSECNKNFFDDLLSHNDLVLPKEALENYLEQGCQFPSSWGGEKVLSYECILFALDLEEVIYHSRSSDISFDDFLKDDEVRSAFRNLYLFLLIQLKQTESKKKKEIFKNLEEFFTNNDLMEKQTSEDFLIRFSALKA